MADSSPQALDPEVIDRLRQLTEDGQPDVVKEVLGLFLLDAPTRLQAITAAVAARDAAGLQRAAHTLKGAAGTIGATALQAASRELEEMGRAAAFDRAEAGLAAVQRQYLRLKAEIDQLL